MIEYASPNARLLLPLCMTDSEFDAVMNAMYRLSYRRIAEQMRDDIVAERRWEDDGGAA